MQVCELMTREVVTLPRSGTVRDARVLMQRHRIRHLPIVEGDQLVGVISERDIHIPSLSGQWNKMPWFEGIPITWVTSCPAVALPPSASVNEAAKLIMERKLACVPILEGGRLVGILTASDLLRQRIAKANYPCVRE